MKLLVLPSRRLILSENSILKSTPIECEDIIRYGNYLALHHYKTFSIYSPQSVLANKPIISQTFLKKLQTFDIYQTQKRIECTISDKFGDMYRIQKAQNQIQQVKPVYINSNLGIPKYLKHVKWEQKQYLVLGDEQNRIKVYNSKNPHQIFSIWHLVNKYSVQCLKIKQNLIILFKYFDKLTLDESIELHILNTNQLESDQYPGISVNIQYKFEPKKCKYYTIVPFGDQVVLALLQSNKIVFQVFSLEGQSKKVKQIEISEGNWDYLYVTEGQQSELLAVYGCDVQVNIQLKQSEWKEADKIQFNQYEFFCKLKI